MTERTQLLHTLDQLLESDRFRDYGPNGLQVEGASQVRKIVSGVTASRALIGGKGHYLVLLTLEETDILCDYIRHGGNKADFLARFQGAFSEGFDPDLHLRRVGIANQTTLLQGETEEVQRRFRAVMEKKYGA